MSLLKINGNKNMQLKRLTADPLHGSILKNMIIFTLPLIGVSVLYSLFNSIDTMVIGNFGEENAVSAIGASQSVIWTIIGVVINISAGVSMIFGRLYGADEKGEISRLLHALPLSSMAAALALAVPAIIAGPYVLRAVNCPAEILSDALLYYRIYFCMVPFMVVFGFLSAVIQSKGDSFTPMLLQITGAAANLGLNLLFVISFRWNIFGVALATVLSQMLSTTLLIIHLTRRKDELHLDLHSLRFFSGTGEIWRKGIPSSAEGFILNITATVVASFINGFSPVIIAGNSIAGSIEGIVMAGSGGFSNAAVVFVAQNYGANDMKRVRRSFFTALATVSVLCLSAGSLAWLFADKLAGIFTADPEIAAAAVHRLKLLSFFYFLCGTMNMLSGAIRGLQEARIPLIISLVASVGFRLCYLMFVARPAGTVEAVYMAFPFTWGLASLLSLVSFGYVYKKRTVKTVN